MYVICLEYHYVGVLALVCLFAFFVLSFVFTSQFYYYFCYHHHHYLFVFPFCYAKSSCFSPLCSFLGFHKRRTRYVLS